jgi:dsDNA-binding SOS-regulon protein
MKYFMVSFKLRVAFMELESVLLNNYKQIYEDFDPSCIVYPFTNEVFSFSTENKLNEGYILGKLYYETNEDKNIEYIEDIFDYRGGVYVVGKGNLKYTNKCRKDNYDFVGISVEFDLYLDNSSLLFEEVNRDTILNYFSSENKEDMCNDLIRYKSKNTLLNSAVTCFKE